MLRFLRALVAWILAPIFFYTSRQHSVKRHVSPPDETLFPFYMHNKDGLWLKWTEWRPRAAVSKGVVFLVGGLGEHNARYDSVALRFSERMNFVVFSMDHQGQGASEGDRKHVVNFSDYVDDYEQFVEERLSKEPSLRTLPRFILGHSMGGLITTHLARRRPHLFSGVVLSAPALQVDEAAAPPAVQKIAKLLRCVLPKIPIDGLNPNFVSRNPIIVEQYKTDPLINKGRLRANWAVEMMTAMSDVFDHVDQITFPYLLIHGTGDKIVKPSGSTEFFKRSASKDKELVMFEGLHHEMFTDVEKERVFAKVFAWIDAHVAAGQSA